ncbi:uncharacterized protein N7459_000791 [Penicillium hispanicum]|uniref:uncharacterized protein n=1 Tax=Penicillium hispanicum TaxID=1080232 RepID=UPI0025417C2D|nr:uncharacterized protein N7459_000791 [Penicillium hispanicum]KAJ5594583.1 hypothetical protein N7459_000791 [Penicillium hispanicum]
MFDRTMLAPGPAGTSMIGERTIEGAARRGLERQRHEREQQTLALENKLSNENRMDCDTRSEKTLTAQKSSTTDSDLHSETKSTAQTSIANKGSHSREDEDQTF